MMIRLRNLSSFGSWLAPRPTDYMEDYYIDQQEVDKGELKRSMDRLKRMQALICLSLCNLDDVFRFKYPFFSVVCYLLLNLIVYSIDFNCMLSNFLGMLLVILILNHPVVAG